MIMARTDHEFTAKQRKEYPQVYKRALESLRRPDNKRQFMKISKKILTHYSLGRHKQSLNEN